MKIGYKHPCDTQYGFFWCVETFWILPNCWAWTVTRRFRQHLEHFRKSFWGKFIFIPVTLLRCFVFKFDETLFEPSFFEQNIRSKISIRAEDRPKAVEAKILSQSGTLSEFGSFKITPGEIVSAFDFFLTYMQKCSFSHTCWLFRRKEKHNFKY